MNREVAQLQLLQILASITHRPMALFESRQGDMMHTASEPYLADFNEPYCCALRSIPKGRETCNQDMRRRAREAMCQGGERLIQCHAGLWNQVIPIRIDGVTRAVVLYGAMRIHDDSFQNKTMRKHREAMNRLQMTTKHEEHLQQKVEQVNCYSLEQLEEMRTIVRELVSWLFSTMDMERAFERRIEDMIHELQIRLQALLAYAEILNTDLSGRDYGSESHLGNTSEAVLNATLALSSLIQSLSCPPREQAKDCTSSNRSLNVIRGE